MHLKTLSHLLVLGGSLLVACDSGPDTASGSIVSEAEAKLMCDSFPDLGDFSSLCFIDSTSIFSKISPEDDVACVWSIRTPDINSETYFGTAALVRATSVASASQIFSGLRVGSTEDVIGLGDEAYTDEAGVLHVRAVNFVLSFAGQESVLCGGLGVRLQALAGLVVDTIEDSLP